MIRTILHCDLNNFYASVECLYRPDLFAMKWPQGYRCPKCKHNRHYEVKTRRLTLFECKTCGYQATVTVGNVMEKSRTQLNKWFLAIFLAAHDKRGVSAKLIAREAEVAYKTAWLLKWLHTILSNAKAFIAGTYLGLTPSICRRTSMNSATALIAEDSKANSQPTSPLLFGAVHYFF